MSHGSPKAKRACYNEPLPVGIVVLIGTCLFQYFGWKYQQQYIAEQSRTAAATALSQATIDDVTKAVGSQLTAAASYVAAHRTRMNKPQLDETIDDYNRLQREWDLGVALLKSRVRRWFSNINIETPWNGILERLGALDEEVNKLVKFKTDDSAMAHQQQIESCTAIIEDTEQRLADLNHLMTDQLTVTLPR
jgi:hypothetical protein